MLKKKKLDGTDKTNLVFLISKIVLVSIQLIVSVMLLISIISMGVLSDFILVLIGVALLLLLILNVVFLIVRKRTNITGQIVCIIIAFIIIICSFLVMRYTGAFNAFLNRVTKKQPELKEYSVMVLEESDVDEVKELNGKGVGFLRSDLTASLAEEELNRTVNIESNLYDDYMIMDEMMNDRLLDAVVLESARIEVMKEEATNVLDGKRIIYTFTIELPEDEKAINKKEITEEPFLVYISGIDSRSGFQEASFSDVNMLVAVNPKKGSILLVSVPRDSYVQLHGTTGLKDKLTHAGLYGINMSKATIEDLLNIQIDYTVKVSFDAVVGIVDELGGIEINSDVPMSLKVESKNKYCTYIEGRQLVDGDCALRFARERKTYLMGDFHRMANQQEVLTAIIDKTTSSKEYFLNLPEMLDAISDTMNTSLSQEDITKFIRLQLAEQISWKVESITISSEYEDKMPTYSFGQNLTLYAMHLDANSIEDAHNKIMEQLKD